MSKRSRLAAVAAGIVMVVVVGALTPAGAHVSSSIDHLWSEHIRPRVVNEHYTKKESNGRYYTKNQSNLRYYTRTQANGRYYKKSESNARYYTKSQANAAFAPFGVSDLARYCGTPAGNAYAPCQTGPRTVSDTANSTGHNPDVAIGADGFPIVAFHDNTSGNLLVAHCGDPTCTPSEATVSTVDNSANDVGERPAIAIGADGLPVISYFDNTADDLYVAKCNDHQCAGGDETLTVVAPDNEGAFNDIVVSEAGLPIVAFQDVANDTMEIVRCTAADCSTFSIEATFGPNADIGEFVSMALGSDGRAVIAVYDAGDGNLLVARCLATDCDNGVSFETVDGTGAENVGGETSVTIGADGFPVVAYEDVATGHLLMVDCNDIACDGGNETITTLDSTINDVYDTSIITGFDGDPIVAYAADVALDGKIRIVDCDDRSCAGETPVELDTVVPTSVYAAVALGTDGIPVVAYHDDDGDSLDVARHIA